MIILNSLKYTEVHLQLRVAARNLVRNKTYFMLLCLLSWSLQFPIDVNVLSQCWHLNGLSPVCTLICTSRLPFSANIFEHPSYWHLWRSCPKCLVLLCISNLLALANDLKQLSMPHTNLSLFSSFSNVIDFLNSLA